MWHQHRALFIALLVLTVARWVLAGVIELSSDEAYYLMWSQHPDWSYYSKGPGVAWAIKAGTWLFGENAFGVRFFSPLLGLGTSLLIFRLGRSLFDSHTGAWSVVLINVTPIFNAGSIVMTIDPPSIFFWTASLFALWVALHRASPWSGWWLLAGLLAGVGFLFKYTNALLLVGLVLLVLAPRWRRLWLRPGPWLFLAAFAPCLLPVAWWNQRHGWITVTHLLERGKIGEATGFGPASFFEYLGLHAGVYSPLLFAGLLWAAWRAAAWARRDAAVHFIAVFSLPIVVLYFALSFKEAGEPNWTAPGFVGLGILLVHCFRHLGWPAGRKAGLRGAALGLGILLCAVAMNFDLIRRAGGMIPHARDPLSRMRGWRETALAAEGFVRAHVEATGREPFLIAQRYQLAASLSHYLAADLPVLRPTPAHPRVHVAESPVIRNQFSFWPRYDERDPEAEPASAFLGRDALFLSDGERDGSAPAEIRHAFARVEPTAVIEIRRLGLPLRKLKIFTCSGYQGLDW
jgi:4-amino-4-deoxy-L-arabinose transferase-like glycosyltransferase